MKYGLGYNINTKLTATSKVTIDCETVSKPITLQQNGSFTFDVGHENADSVVVKYVDAVGNSAEQVIFVGNQKPDDKLTYIVPADDIESQIGDEAPKEVTVSVPQLEDALNVEIDGALVKTLENSKKDLVIESDDLTFTLARKVVEKLSKGTHETLTIALTKEATNENAISDVYSFHFATGKDLTEINIGKEKIDVTLAVDASDLKKTNQLWAQDLNSGKSYKVKYKNDIAAFEADGPGKFVVVK